MASSRDLVVRVIGDDRSLQKAYKSSTAATQKFERETKQSLRGVVAGSGAYRAFGRQVAFASGAFLGAAGFTNVVKTSIGAASDLNEAITKSDVVFGANAKQVEHWSGTLASSFGLAKGEALGIASSFGALFVPMGLIGEKAAQQSEKLTQLGADLASFYNTDVTDALQAVQSGLVGQSRPLRRYGILLDAARVQQEALRQTGKKHASELTNQEKVLARINILYHDSAQAQGDFERTSGGLANQQRILKANLQNLEEALGEKLIPALSKAVGFVNDLVDASKKSSDQTKKHGATVTILSKGIHIFGQAIADEGRKLDGYANKVVAADKKIAGAAVSLFNRIARPGPGGQSVADLVPGLSAAGPAAFGIGPLSGAAGSGSAAAIRRRASIDYQISLANQRLARAQITASQADDRAALVGLQALLQRKIKVTKSLKDRTQLYQDLGSVTNQIKSIDDKAAADRKARNEKELQAEKDRRDKELAHQKKIREQIQAQSDKVNREFKKMVEAQKAAAEKLKARLKAATDNVRSQLGALFSGPILNPTESATKGILGVTGGGGPSIGTLTRDVIAQTAAFVTRNNDLARLARAGAPAALLKQLRDTGDAGLIHTLATGKKGDLARLFKAVNAQEKVIQQIAHADIQAKTVVVHAGNVRHAAATPYTQRRGRAAGVQGGYTRGD